jgi:(E)-4-hydroxy-3-methylbut-2-enyl-diphosphate synthase
LAGANKRSGLYINGERQKTRIDNNQIVDQLETQIRDYIAKKSTEQQIDVKLVE